MDIDRFTVLTFVGLVIGVILHEISHGVVAFWFGDDTARRAGRLTLNPIPHVDVFGSLILPAMGALTGVPVIGYAKPVPVNPQRLRKPRRDMLIVSLAGPTTNMLLTVGAALLARALYTPTGAPVIFFDDLSLPVQFLLAFASVNVFLGLFNLLPIPPLDGAALIERVLPHDWLPYWYRFRPYGVLVLVLFVLWVLPRTDLFDDVVQRVYEFILT